MKTNRLRLRLFLALMVTIGLFPLYSQNQKVIIQTSGLPDWNVNPTLFSYDGEIRAQILLDHVPVNEGNGILGAFVGEVCRGVITGGINGPTGKYVFIIRCYSNIASGETLTFKYYDPVLDKTFNIAETVPFESNMIIGTFVLPSLFNAFSYDIQISKNLSSGWSWFSLNVSNADMSIAHVLSGMNATDGDYIKNQTISATYYSGTGWFGELTQINPKEMYKIKLGKADVLLFEGNPVDPPTNPITINNGWNWIGYLPQVAKSIADALSSINPVSDDYIKNQIASSAFYDGAGWFGELNSMHPLDGFMLKTSHSATLVFPISIEIVEPTVTTSEISAISDTSAYGGGNVTSDGGAAVTARGVCWSTLPSPTFASSKTTDSTGTGTFTSNLTSLTANSTYHVRAYATNSAGTGYGEEKQFITLNSSLETFTDSRDNHVYKKVTIGTQTWMAENLAYLPAVSPPAPVSQPDPYYYVYGYNGTNVTDAQATENYDTYGVLYNWPAAMTACPSGWHIPNDEEWTTLSDFLGGEDSAGGKMKEAGTTHWMSPNTGATNESRFSALPGGEFIGFGAFINLGRSAGFWSSSEIESSPWYRYLYSNRGVVDRIGNSPGFGGISVRCLLGPRPAFSPTVTTAEVSEITLTSASSGGNVTSDGGAEITARGVCWSTSANPTIADSKTTDGSGMGAFSSSLSGLTAGTAYFVRAYAINSVGTAYGQNQLFGTTVAGISTFTDERDGHEYKTVPIGTQIWMAENLAWLPAVSPSSAESLTSSCYYVYGFDGNTVSEAKASGNYSKYGVLYNWIAATTACPAGWHLPSDAEWMILEKNMGMSQSESEAEQWRFSGTVGGKLKESGTSHWFSPNTGATNTSGFTALPGGYNRGGFCCLGSWATFWSWSATENGYFCWYRSLGFGTDGVEREDFYNISLGFSVRCLRGSVTSPTVSTTEVSAITETTASTGGNVTSDGGDSVTARGVCWSVSSGPTINGSKTIDGTGTGTFTSSLTLLPANTTIYVRAYATNSAGTGYGEEKQFITSKSGGTFIDIRDGHVYKRVTIVTQTWMAENLAYLPAVSLSSAGSEADPYYYVYGYQGTNIVEAKSTANYTTSGVLYNWVAAKTVCPIGWHLPTDEEWKILEKNLGMSNSDADATGRRNSGTVGGKLKETGTTHWSSPNTGATNTSGFTALPGGNRYTDGKFYNLINNAHYWSSTGNGGAYAWSRSLYMSSEGVNRESYNNGIGMTVRCLRN